MWRNCAVIPLVVVAGTPVLWAGEDKEGGDADAPWKLSATGSLSAADGNSESLAWSLQMLAEYSGEVYDARIGFDHFYAESNSVESANSYKLHEQLTRDLNEDWYLGQYASALTDAVADIDYRFDTSFLLGRRLLDGEKAKLSVELGPGYAWEEKAGDGDHYMTARLGQRFEYQFTEDVRLWQSLAWTPRVEDPGDSVYELELGIENRLNGRLSLRSFVRHRVDSDPAAGSGRGDTVLLVGFNYDFSEDEDQDEAVGPDLRPLWLGNALGLKDKNWITTASIGLTFNRGNADKTGLKLGWESDFTSEDLEIDLELDHQMAEDGNRTSTDRTSSRVQINRTLKDPNYVGFAIGFLRDDLADIDYRLTPSVVFGRNLIKNERTQLAVEAGPRYTLEQTGQGSDQLLSLLLAQRLEHRFSERVSLDQSFEVASAYEDPEDFTLAAKIALDTKLNDHLSWRWQLESRYENQPVSGRDHHDLIFTSGVAASF